MLSIIVSARNDNYGGDFLKRFQHCLENNIKNLRYAKIEFEYIVAEWCPDNALIHEFPELFSDSSVIDLIIDKSVSKQEGLRSDVFYEYFAKNAGLRHAKYDNVLVMNADILLGYDLINNILNLIQAGLNNKNYYRPSFRHNYNLTAKQVLHTQPLWEPHNPDGHLAAGYSGDFLLALKSVLIDDGRAYDETDPGHRSNFQRGMDGEILYNMYHKGIHPFMIDAGYYHIDHSKNRNYSGSNYRENISYNNKPNWGFIDYKKDKLNDQLYWINA